MDFLSRNNAGFLHFLPFLSILSVLCKFIDNLADAKPTTSCVSRIGVRQDMRSAAIRIRRYVNLKPACRAQVKDPPQNPALRRVLFLECFRCCALESSTQPVDEVLLRKHGHAHSRRCQPCVIGASHHGIRKSLFTSDEIVDFSQIEHFLLRFRLVMMSCARIPVS